MPEHDDLPEVIYVANPYTGTKEERAERFRAVEKFVAHLIRQGETAISPIVHNHELSINHNMPGDFAFWQKYCLNLLLVCDKLYVLMLDGWDTSVGVHDEVVEANELEIPIFYIDPITYEVVRNG